MKKFICIIAIIILLLNVLTGCENSSEEKTTPIPDVDPSLVDSVCEKWVMQEVKFTAQKNYADPFNDVTLDV